MIVELSTNFSDMEKNMLKQWGDVDVKLYIDLHKIVDSSYVFNKERNIADDRLIEFNAVEMPNMIPNRIICVAYFHWLVELKNEPGIWYVGLRGKDGTIICYDKHANLETAFHDSMKKMLKSGYNITQLTREKQDEIEELMLHRYPYHYFMIHDIDANKANKEDYFRKLYIEARYGLKGVKVSDNTTCHWQPEIYDLMTGFDTAGRTIIPPASLSDFKTILQDTLWKCTEPDKTKFGWSGKEPISDFEMAIDIYVTETLIKLTEQAQAENKFIIHFGI